MRIEADWLNCPASRAIFSAFSGAEKSAYFVGGCVRNQLLGAPVADLDIATNALPEETLAIAQAVGLRAIPTGIEHGTITLISEGTPFEVTTFRRDVQTDGRRAAVAFSDNIEEDAKRRDFTMNALYADPTGQVIDPLGGLPDLLSRKVRFIENAEHRIAEDYLRILRFFRFHAWYGDVSEGLDPDGLAACAAGIAGIANLSKERIGAEMCKLLAAPDPAPAVAAMAHSGVLGAVLPGADAQYLAPLVHLEQASCTPEHWRRRLAVLGGNDQADLLRLSRSDAKYLHGIRECLETGYGPAKAAYIYGAEIALDAALVLAAGTSTHPVPGLADEIANGVRAIFPIKASDLAPALSGKALGIRLKELEARWITSGFQASKDDLLD